MSFSVSNTNGVMSIEDNMNPRCSLRLYLCGGGCGKWISEDEVIWADKNGKLTTAVGSLPYCDDCLPEDISEANNEIS